MKKHRLRILIAVFVGFHAVTMLLGYYVRSRDNMSWLNQFLSKLDPVGYVLASVWFPEVGEEIDPSLLYKFDETEVDRDLPGGASSQFH